MANEPSLYGILGVEPDATEEEIKVAANSGGSSLEGIQKDGAEIPSGQEQRQPGCGEDGICVNHLRV